MSKRRSQKRGKGKKKRVMREEDEIITLKNPTIISRGSHYLFEAFLGETVEASTPASLSLNQNTTLTLTHLTLRTSPSRVFSSLLTCK